MGRRLILKHEVRRSPAFPHGAYAVLARVSPGYPPLQGRFLRVTHPSATLLIPEGTFAFDLHVLGLPPAFNLSHDQTLQFNLYPLPLDKRELLSSQPGQSPKTRLSNKNNCIQMNLHRSLAPIVSSPKPSHTSAHTNCLIVAFLNNRSLARKPLMNPPRGREGALYRSVFTWQEIKTNPH